MARYFDVHPENPQPRSVMQVAQIITDGALVVWPTDSAFALGCLLGNREGLDRIRTIRRLDSSHHFTLVVREFAQLGEFVKMSTPAFRAVRACTPGPYTFILNATRELPRAMLHPKKKTVGVRIPQHVTARALLKELGEPIVSSTLIMPGEEYPLSDGWAIKELLENRVDAVLDSGDVSDTPTTVVDLSGDEPVVLRQGAGDVSLFE